MYLFNFKNKYLKIKEIQTQFNQFFSTLAEPMKYNNNNDREELVTKFFINNLYYLLVKLSDFDAIKEEKDADSFDKVLNNKREMYLNLLINKYCENMNKVLKRCVSKNDKNANNQNQNEINFIDEEVNKLNKNDLKNIAQNFNSKYRDILNNVKKSIYSSITDNENAKITYKAFLNELLNKYAAFIDLLRYSKNEDLLMNSVGVQKLMIEINNIMKGI